MGTEWRSQVSCLSLRLCSWGEDFVSRRQETPQQQQADTETELRDSPPADSQINTGFFRVPPWSRSELLPKVLTPLQTTSTTMNHQLPPPPPHSLASLYTRGKKEEPAFLTSHGAFSRDTSLFDKGVLGITGLEVNRNTRGSGWRLSWAPPAPENQDQDPA